MHWGAEKVVYVPVNVWTPNVLHFLHIKNVLTAILPRSSVVYNKNNHSPVYPSTGHRTESRGKKESAAEVGCVCVSVYVCVNPVSFFNPKSLSCTNP